MKTASLRFKLQMAVLGLAYATIGALTASAQSTIDFRNSVGTAISTNDLAGHSGLISGAGNYRFGLYMGPFGSNPNALLLSGVTANGSIAGLFGTGNPVLIGFSVGTQVSFQVRGWSDFAGSSYESALAYATGGNLPLAYLGTSTPGSFTVPASGSVIIFGAGPGQVGGFELTPIPEPSAAMLGVLGLGLLGLYTRARKAWSTTA